MEIDLDKIRDALSYADSSKQFADTSAANLDVNTPPRGIDGSDPQSVEEIVAMELALQAVYNKEFLTNPAAPMSFYVDSPSRSFYDLLVPGEYYGDEVTKYFQFRAPGFIGRLEFKEMKVAADQNIGFVVMKQNYFGKDIQGTPIHWIMRQTDGVVKINGVWKIMHSHVSFPIKDFETCEGDLKSPKRPFPWDQQ